MEAPRTRKPVQIQNVDVAETTENFIEKHFRGFPLHRCKATTAFDIDSIVEHHRSSLIRSAQELEPNPNGIGQRPFWTMLAFQRAERVFWHLMFKSSNYGRSQEKEYALTVTADTPEKAAEEALMIQKMFTAGEDAPGFLMLNDLNKPRRIPLRPEYFLSAEMLDLHYGPGFSQWAAKFSSGLSQNGLSILRGKPGTGKTSFLRHIIFSLFETHRFYYLPVDSFGYLEGSIPDFLLREKKRFKAMTLVLVLEDAEQLLVSRRGMRDSQASSLLNFTDGFIGDMVKAHLICTVNSEFRELDKAVLRPGRQRFFREFDLLTWEQSQALANKLGVPLKEARPYSLAEIYHFKDMEESEPLDEGPVIGFTH